MTKLSEHRSRLQKAASALLIVLMVYITFNDVIRLPKFIKAFQRSAPSMEQLETEEKKP